MKLSGLVVVALLAVPAAAQAQLARFDFQNQLSSAPSPFGFAPDAWLSKAYQYSGPAADRALSLPLSWNSGGNLVFTIFPGYGETFDFSHLHWFVMPNAAGVADCVSGVTISANGVQVASFSPIPQNVDIDVNLTGFASLQNRTQPVTFDFSFIGNPTGTAPHDIDYIQVTGSACDLALHSITPASLPTASTEYFQIIGAGIRDAQGSKITQVKFGGVVLDPYSGIYGVGSYEAFTQWKLRIRPPPCTPPGTYTIEVTSTCDTKTIQATLYDPVLPTIAGEPEHPAGVNQCVTLHGGAPGPKILFLFITPDNTPSILPGILDLQIGGGFSIIDTHWVIGDCGRFCFPILSEKVDSFHYHQGVVWAESNLDFHEPLPTTSVLTTYLF